MDSDITIIQSSLLPLHVAVEMADGVVQERTFTHSFRIGRAPECEYQLMDHSVSRAHAEICFEVGHWWVKDLSSTNGTYLNGSRVDRALLPPQSKIEIGEITKEPHVIFWLGINAPPSIDHAHTVVSASKVQESIAQALHSTLIYPLNVQFIDDNGRTKETEFSAPFSLGRSPKSDFCLDIQLVSKTHVQFIFKNDQWWVVDAQSTNGTYLDGKKISEYALYEKTQIQLGLGGPVISVEPQPSHTQTQVEQKEVISNPRHIEESKILPQSPVPTVDEPQEERDEDDLTGPQFIRPPKRWDESFGPNMTQAMVDRILDAPPFKEMDPKAFSSATPLRDILLHDTRIIRYQPGDIVFRQGEFGNSAFFILSGSVRLLLENLPEWAKNDGEQERKGFLKTFAQLWEMPKFPETRDFSGGSLKSQSLENNTQNSTAQIFLQDFSSILTKFGRASLTAGEFFGEYSALGRTPRTATVICDQPTEIVEIRWQGLRDLRSRSPVLKDHIDTVYRERNLEHHFRVTPIFQHMTDEQLKRVAEQTTFETYGNFDWHTKFKNLADKNTSERIEDEPIIANEGEYPNGMILVRSGFARLSQRLGEGHRTLSFLQRGQTFGFDELLHNHRSPKQIPLQYSLRAIGYVDLLFIPTVVVEEIILPTIPADVLPVLRDGSSQYMESSSSKQDGDQFNLDPEMVEFLVGERFINGTATMVIDLDRCTRCDDCVRACAATHDNNPRFIRHGKQFGPYMVANACMHCADPVCMIGCPTGAIQRNAFHGNVIINDDICIGCATCANSCPYNNIRMVETRDKNGNVFLDQDSHKPIMKATKCDLCSDQRGGPACQRACPHSALTRIGLQDLTPLAQWMQR